MKTVSEYFRAQVAHKKVMSMTSAKERKRRLLKLKASVLFHREEIKEALFLDFKKPYAESELTEIHTVLDEINFAVKHLSKWMKAKRVTTPLVLLGSSSHISYEAKGVVLVLAPWNYPFSLLINPLVAAISAGNCVMAKPSEKTPATSKILKKIIDEVFPAEEAVVVLGEIQLAEELLELPFDHIFFTGSTQVGKKVMASAAKNLTPVTLELGGKSPVIIDCEVDLQDCVEKICWGKFLNGGQTCVAPDYIFIPEELKEKFVISFKKEIEKRFGDTSAQRLHSSDLARVIDTANFERLVNKIENEKKLLSDECLKEDLYLPPTLLPNVDYHSPIMKEEIFGPILPLLTYQKIDEALSFIQQSPKPLALYIFSKRKKMIKEVLQKTTSGGVAINHVILHLANPYLPFGGVGPSGLGSYHGEFGFKTFSHERAILKQGAFTLSKLYFPPYHGFWHKIAFKILRWLE